MKIKNRPEIWILFIGLIIRLLFVFILAKPYFGRENIYVDKDTYSFAWAFQSVYETGTYTVNPDLEYGYFGRMPGYPFFIGIFYILCDNNWEKAFLIIPWIQLLMDLFSAWLLYLIMLKLSKNKRIALIALGLYACYPFVVVWAPVVYAETLGVFLALLAMFFFVERKKKWNLLISGAIVGFGILVRPQTVLLVPAVLVVLLIDNYRNISLMIKNCFKFLLPVLIIYGIWPARNYINHDKLIFTQDLRGFYNWDIDVMAFWSYVYSVKSEWDPQYTQIITNQKVSWPKEAFLTKADSMMLEEAVYLSKNCGSGFSHKVGYWKKPFDAPNCNKEIESLFLILRERQIKNNPWNFFVKVPLANLRKALFKTRLYDTGTFARKLASFLFYYRSLLILFGLAFYILLIFKSEYRNKDLLLPIIFFVFLYLLLCAGTSPQMRNIEMRYFLPADVLLLLPAAYFIHILLNSIGLRNKG